MVLPKPSTKVNAIPAPARARDLWEVLVRTIHCHFCGGVVPARAKIEYRPPRSSAQVALPQPGTCTCTPPIVYEDSPLDDPPPDDEQVESVTRAKHGKPVEQVKHIKHDEHDAPTRPADPWKGAH
jgi:hypothetical protein